jgi:transcriptional regulator with XRE-family HTH domain
MTPKQLKAARKKLRLSAAGLANAIGMQGRWVDRTVRAWERGEYAVPDYVADAVAGLLVERDDHLAAEAAWRALVGHPAYPPCMGARDRDVIKRVAKGETFAAVGRRHGITRERVRQIWNDVYEPDRATLLRYWHKDNR